MKLPTRPCRRIAYTLHVSATAEGRVSPQGDNMNKIQPLLAKYERNRVIRGLIQLVPFGIGSAIDVVLTKTLEKIQAERATAFFDELASGNVIVDESLLESEDFLHAYYATTRAALNSRKREKIRMFARLLKSSLKENEISNIDEYEDFVKILDELSYRELMALKILDEFSVTPRPEDQNDLEWTNQFWDKFEKHLTAELSIPGDQVVDFMNRIARTGCYEMFMGGYFDYTGGRGKLTSTYQRLKKFIEEENRG